MRPTTRLMAAICGVLVLAAGCGGPKVYLAVDRPVVLPPEIAALTRIAVLPIPCDENKAYGDMLTAQIESRLFEKFKQHAKHPELATRTDIDKVIEEMKLPLLDSEDAAAGIASVVRADAVIFGRISVVIRETYREQSGIPVPVVGGLFPPRPVVESSALVTATLSMASVEAGKAGAILRTKSILRRQGWLGTREKTVEEAIGLCVLEFLESIVPPSLRAVYELRMAGSGDEDVKAGNTYAKMGAFGDAAERFAVATARNPKDHAALYNLGVMQISLNKQDDAADHLQKALALKVDENYVWAQEVLRQLGPNETPRKAEKHEKERGPVIKKP